MAKVRKSIATAEAAGALGKALEGALVSWLADTSPSDIWNMCITCNHFNEQSQQCGFYKRTPPAKVICGQVTCQAYEDGEVIPF